MFHENKKTMAWCLVLWVGVARSARGLQIVGETSRWIVVDKATGVSMHGPSSLIARLREERPEARDWRYVHRLDDGTSGCVAIAKDKKAARSLALAFRRRQAKKLYVGVSAKKMPRRKTVTFVGDMDRSRRGAWKLRRECTPGRCACTDLRIYGGVDARFVIAKPFTGRTHQIRVAAKAAGIPLLGDRTYGGAAADRLYLHAAGLSIPFEDDDDIFVLSRPTEGDLFHTPAFDDFWRSRIDTDLLRASDVSRACQSLAPVDTRRREEDQ